MPARLTISNDIISLYLLLNVYYYNSAVVCGLVLCACARARMLCAHACVACFFNSLC